jgi:hypothetical protein
VPNTGLKISPSRRDALGSWTPTKQQPPRFRAEIGLAGCCRQDSHQGAQIEKGWVSCDRCSRTLSSPVAKSGSDFEALRGQAFVKFRDFSFAGSAASAELFQKVPIADGRENEMVKAFMVWGPLSTRRVGYMVPSRGHSPRARKT